jgi:hypothetical protein
MVESQFAVAGKRWISGSFHQCELAKLAEPCPLRKRSSQRHKQAIVMGKVCVGGKGRMHGDNNIAQDQLDHWLRVTDLDFRRNTRHGRPLVLSFEGGHTRINMRPLIDQHKARDAIGLVFESRRSAQPGPLSW